MTVRGQLSFSVVQWRFRRIQSPKFIEYSACCCFNGAWCVDRTVVFAILYCTYRNSAVNFFNGSKLSKRIYKVVSRSEWAEALAKGVFLGSQVDLDDGYIHFSTAEQLADTLAKHFAAQPDLVLLTVGAAALGDGLKWEPSRGGQLFPHLYGELDCNAVAVDEDLELDDDGVHVLPELT